MGMSFGFPRTGDRVLQRLCRHGPYGLPHTVLMTSLVVAHFVCNVRATTRRVNALRALQGLLLPRDAHIERVVCCVERIPRSWIQPSVEAPVLP